MVTNRSNFWTRLNRTRVPRRYIIRAGGVAGLGLAGTALVGCGDDDDVQPDPTATLAPGETPQPTATGEPTATQAPTATPTVDPDLIKRGGTLRLRENSQAGRWDSVSATSTTQRQVGPAYNGLIQFDPLSPGTELISDLAESSEVSDDGLTWVFSLRKGVKFHDGTSFTAEDVAQNMARQISPPTGIPSGLQPFYEPLIAGVDVQDDSTVTFRLNFVNALFPILTALTKIVPKGRAASAIESPADVIGTGPFAVSEHEPDVSLTYARFEDYFVPNRPYLDKITMSYIRDEEAALTAFRGGNIDLLSDDGMTPEQAEALTGNDGVTVRESPSTIWFGLSLNSAEAPLDDPRVRQAIMMAIDNNAVGKGRFGNLYLQGGIVVPGSWGLSDNDLQAIPGYGLDADQNKADARLLLADAGFEDGLTLKHISGTAGSLNGVSLIMQSQLAEVGIELDIDFIAGAEAVKARRSGQYVSIVGGDSYPTDDPLVAVGRSYISTSPEPFPAFDSPAVDALYEKLLTTFEPEERRKLSNEVDTEILTTFKHKNAIWRVFSVANRDYVKNVVPAYNPYANYHRHENTWLDNA